MSLTFNRNEDGWDEVYDRYGDIVDMCIPIHIPIPN